MKELSRAFLVFVVFLVVTGLAYPFAVTGLARLFFPDKAKGSLIIDHGKVVGSALIGQKFTGPRYFHGRPSANDYDAGNSGGTNFGPASAKLLEGVASRIKQVRAENGLSPEVPIPADLVLASASGLDPHITVEAALVQVARVAKARGLSDEEIGSAIKGLAEGHSVGGEGRVNVLKLNMKLDAMANAGITP